VQTALDGEPAAQVKLGPVLEGHVTALPQVQDPVGEPRRTVQLRPCILAAQQSGVGIPAECSDEDRFPDLGQGSSGCR